jgi:hypothetical protein
MFANKNIAFYAIICFAFGKWKIAKTMQNVDEKPKKRMQNIIISYYAVGMNVYHKRKSERNPRNIFSSFFILSCSQNIVFFANRNTTHWKL